MRIGVGFKTHSGWAALVAIGSSDDEPRVIERRRIELTDPDTLAWAKQPYHAAHDLPPREARELVDRGVEAAHRVALKELRALSERWRNGGHDVIGCGILSGPPLPDWTTDQILAVHIRMHKAEGALFPAALAHAANTCHLNRMIISQGALNAPDESLDFADAKQLDAIGKAVGPPWGADQKCAALAAMIVLRKYSRH